MLESPASKRPTTDYHMFTNLIILGLVIAEHRLTRLLVSHTTQTVIATYLVQATLQRLAVVILRTKCHVVVNFSFC